MRARQISQVLCLLVGVAAFDGCGTDAGLSRSVRLEDYTFARAYFDSVRTGRIDYALAKLEPPFASLVGERDSLVMLSRYLPSEPLDSFQIIGATRFTSSTIDRSNLTYEYHSAQGWGIVTIAITRRPPTWFIEGIHARRLTQSLEQSNALTLQGKGAGHYLMLLLLFVCIVSPLWVAVLALRTDMKRRWAWALLALVGTGAVMFNWTTGQVGFRVLSLLFLNAEFGRAAPAAPWILQAAFPIGAIMTWRRIQQARSSIP